MIVPITFHRPNFVRSNPVFAALTEKGRSQADALLSETPQQPGTVSKRHGPIAVLRLYRDRVAALRHLEARGASQASSAPEGLRPADTRPVAAAQADSSVAPAAFDRLNPLVKAQLERILGTSLAADNPDLAAALDVHVRLLSKVLDTIRNYRQDGRQPDETIARYDCMIAPHVLAMENERHPNLQAEYFDTLEDFISRLRIQIEENTSVAPRALVRMGEATGDEETLHVVPIDLKAGPKLSLIVIEPANLYSPTVMHAINALNRDLASVDRPYVWSYIATNLQNSPDDCNFFSQSFLKKMADNPEFMQALHARQVAGRPLDIRDEDQYLQSQEAAAITRPHNLHEIIASTSKLPIAFMKHTQSSGAIDAYLSANPAYEHVKVNKPDTANKRAPQTLRERVAAYTPAGGRQHLSAGPARTLSYSLSIEAKREQTVEKTLEFFRALRGELSLPSPERSERVPRTPSPGA